MLPSGTPLSCTIQHLFLGLNMYYQHADPQQPPISVGEELDDLL